MAVLSQAWQVAAQQVWQYLRRQDVALLEGDVSFTARLPFGSDLQHLHPEASVQLVPGVCSPLRRRRHWGYYTIRQERLVVLPALYTVGELEAL